MAKVKISPRRKVRHHINNKSLLWLFLFVFYGFFIMYLEYGSYGLFFKKLLFGAFLTFADNFFPQSIPLTQLMRNAF